MSEEKMSTPRTDAAKFNFLTSHPATNINQEVVRADFACKLELQNAELLAALQLVRMSNGWRYLADESKVVIDAAIARALG